MSKIGIWLVIIILVILGYFVLFAGNGADDEFSVSLPWIEVTSAGVTASPSGDELFTGDELEQGTLVATDATGIATIYFPDGSRLRLEPDTTVTLTEAFFDEESETLIVRIGLNTGRVWSKVISLVTPQSEWEVKSGNAVATVRGTAFGFSYKDNQSSVIGSEDTVSFVAVDPATDEIILETEVEIATDEVVELSDETVQVLVGEPKKVEIVAISETVAYDEWVGRQRVEDEVVNREIAIIREEVVTSEEVRKKFKESVRSRFKSDIIRQRETVETRSNLDDESAEDRSEDEDVAEENRPDPVEADADVVEPEVTKVETAPGAGEESSLRAQISDVLERVSDESKPEPIPTPSVVAVEIAPLTQLGNIFSGDVVRFKTVIIMSDGEVIEDPQRVKWNGTGAFGEMVEPGAFRVRYDSINPTSAIHELGNISVTVLDEEGREIAGASDSLGLRVQIPEELLERATSDPSFSGLNLDFVDFSSGALR